MDIEQSIRVVWDYGHMNHRMEKADSIIVLGSHDRRVGERGAEVFLQGWAPVIAFSGCLGALTKGVWDRPEAEIFAEIAVRNGVPADRVLIEDRATNTGENAAFSRKLLMEKGVRPQKVIVVHKPYAERRAFVTFKKVWPEVRPIIASPDTALDEYSNPEISRDEFINVMVGDLQRVMEYPRKGYSIPQKIPQDVVRAYAVLVEAGYTRHLIRE